ncbi:MAG: outer membrane lipoprotein-sorting protein [Fidelibacterota bacterium]
MIKIITLITLTPLILVGQNITGDEILALLDKNQWSETSIIVSTMTIHGKRGTRTITSKTWMSGEDQSFTEYISPARQKGVKMLKLKDDLWTYSPKADRTIKIAGHMLRQSLMGSDLSYEDMMENNKLKDAYRATITGEEKINGRDCYVLELSAVESDLAYQKRKLYVDKTKMIAIKEERYAKSGKLLKTTLIEEVMQVDGRWIPKKMIFKDVLSKGAGTEFLIDEIEFEAEIPQNIFSKASLRK